MKRSIVMTLAIIALSIHPSFADGVNPHTHDQAPGVKNVAVIDVPAAAKDAVATVDRFSAALSAGDLATAGKELDPKVLILESGGAERSAVEYLGGHAKGDAAFLKTAHQQLVRRSAHASGDFAWVASESELHLQKDDEPVTVNPLTNTILHTVVRPSGRME